jgi:integrase
VDVAAATEEGGVADTARKPRFNFHSLRHFAASLWIELGFTPKRLQTLLGHSSVQMTFDRYGHLFPSPEAVARSWRRRTSATALFRAATFRCAAEAVPVERRSLHRIRIGD